MDRCYTGLTGTTAEVPGLTLSWSGPITQVVVYSEAEGFVCVEPVTMANDGFGLLDRGIDGTGVVGLDPGATFAVSYRFAWTAG
jgi:galactose mutarotase-like enzyme